VTEQFHNPYHFLPLRSPAPARSIHRDQLAAEPHLNHGIYEGFSGTIICTAECMSPCFLGAAREGAITEPVSLPFRTGHEERLGIPGTSLRGLISNIYGALTRSSLRVLEDKQYSYRDRNFVKHKPPNLRTHDFFRRTDAELLPFNPKRTRITPEETLFGFVEDIQNLSAELHHPALSFASRVQVADAIAWGIVGDGSTLRETQEDRDLRIETPVVLKILAGPKDTPCSALYFRNRDGNARYIARNELSPDRHEPMGRKIYLHHRRSDWVASSGRTWRFQTANRQSDRKQKTEIHPVRPGAVFHFPVRFDNLLADELALLLTAIKPTKQFLHKLGMGKPLGLGSIDIRWRGVFLVDRKRRYSPDGFSAPRYGRHFLCDDDAWRWIPASYAAEHERRHQDEWNAWEEPDGLPLIGGRQEFADILRILEVLGNPATIDSPVHTPVTTAQGNYCETETFEWFVNNQKAPARAQQLKPLDPASRHLQIQKFDPNA